MIYFITARDIGRVKIGYSADPAARLLNLQTASPVELQLERICDGDRDDEDALHDTFSAHRVRGEWFILSAEIEAHMAALPAFSRMSPTSNLSGTDDLAAWMIANSVKQIDLAARCGVSPSTITKIRFGFHAASPELARKIEVETRGDVSADAIIAMRGNRR